MHLHEMRDSDNHFIINPVTMEITNSSQKHTLQQGDHNSEIYTFEIPKVIEGHDMTLCNLVEIHYINIKGDKTERSEDVHTVKDMVASEDDPDTLVFAWTIHGNATKYAGSLNFRIKFGCTDESGAYTYRKHTEIFKGITISEGFDNAGSVEEDHSDVLSQWEARLNVLEQGGGSKDAVLYTPQTLTPEQKAQARKNIGASIYYHTKREEIGVSHENINTAYIWGLYDALMAEHPDKVQKKEHTNNDGTFTNYEYVISTGEYSTEGLYATAYGCDPHIKKPKYLVLNAIHGTERKTTLSTYRFIRDVLSGHNVPPAFREGAILSVMPVGTPSAFDAFTRPNGGSVDINRNFDWEWEEGQGTDGATSFTNGDSAASEKETQAIANWLADNKDAELFIDFHNSGQLNEKAVVLSLPDNSISDMARKVALRGVDRVIPFWRDVIGYPTTVVAKGRTDTDGDGNKIEERDVIFSYSATTEGAGMAFAYAQGVLGIRSIGIEAVVYYGDYYEYKENETSYQPEVIAMGAEALGNILIEFYAQSCEVMAMSEISDNLAVLAKSASFRTESGTIVLEEDMLAASSGSLFTYKIECSNGAKMLDFHADSDTLAAIKESSDNFYVASILGNCFAPGIANHYKNQRSYISMMKETVINSSGDTAWRLIDNGTTVTNTDGCQVPITALKAGTYHWTAYYWNE